MEKEQMTEKEFDAALEALGALAHGTLTITQEIGKQGCSFKTDQHPVIALFGAVCGVEEMIFQAGHTDGELQIRLDRETVEGLVGGIADRIIESILEREEEWQKEHGAS